MDFHLRLHHLLPCSSPPEKPPVPPREVPFAAWVGAGGGSGQGGAVDCAGSAAVEAVRLWGPPAPLPAGALLGCWFTGTIRPGDFAW